MVLGHVTSVMRALRSLAPRRGVVDDVTRSVLVDVTHLELVDVMDSVLSTMERPRHRLAQCALRTVPVDVQQMVEARVTNVFQDLVWTLKLRPVHTVMQTVPENVL